MSLDNVIIFTDTVLYPQAHNHNRFRSKGASSDHGKRGYYHQWFDTSGGGLLIQVGIIRPVYKLYKSRNLTQ